MTTQNELMAIDFGTVARRMLLGAGIGFLLIGLFLLGVKNPDPDWPKYWQVRPLVIVPIAGALGAAFHYMITRVGKNQAVKITMHILGVLGFIIALWLGSVLGLDGTLWD